MTERLHIDYYSDLLCVWAWIAQRRIDELQTQWGDKIEICYRFVDVFGDSLGRIGRQWVDRGGIDGFADHVRHAAEPYETAPVHPDLWRRVLPTSSASSHLILKAVEITSGQKTAETAGLALRQAFFRDAQDISQHRVLMDIIADNGGEAEAVEQVLRDGRALAQLMADYQEAKQHNLKGSPSWIMNDGRQSLYGNVSYRVLSANIEELLKRPQGEASWC